MSAFVLSFLTVSMTGCHNRLIAGIRKVFIQQTPTSATSEKVEQALRNVKPVVSIEDSAGQPPVSEETPPDKAVDRGEVVTSEQAARYRELAMLKPYDALVRYNMGRLYLQQGLLKEATYEFDMATSLDPELANAFILLGRTLRLRGLHDLAIAKLSAAIRLQPGSPTAHTELGISWDQRGFHERAREAHVKALSLLPQDSSIHNNIGYSYFLEGDYGAAIKYYKKALQVAPKDRQMHNNIALAYAMNEKWDKALGHFTEALGEPAAQNNIGHLLLRAGKIDQALAHLEVAVRLGPNSIRALGNLESALRLKGRVNEAEKLHARLVELERAQINPGFVAATVSPSASAGSSERK